METWWNQSILCISLSSLQLRKLIKIAMIAMQYHCRIMLLCYAHCLLVLLMHCHSGKLTGLFTKDWHNLFNVGASSWSDFYLGSRAIWPY